MGQAQGQIEGRQGGKFCRGGIICREIVATPTTRIIVLSAFFLWHRVC
jgi:hypothetical protein